MTRLPYSYQAQIMGRRSFEKMFTVDQMREYAKKVVADEREACAVLAQQTICDTHTPTGINIYGTRAAKAIRARENT